MQIMRMCIDAVIHNDSKKLHELLSGEQDSFVVFCFHSSFAERAPSPPHVSGFVLNIYFGCMHQCDWCFSTGNVISNTYTVGRANRTLLHVAASFGAPVRASLTTPVDTYGVDCMHNVHLCCGLLITRNFHTIFGRLIRKKCRIVADFWSRPASPWIVPILLA